jgi:hypothetical protein
MQLHFVGSPLAADHNENPMCVEVRRKRRPYNGGLRGLACVLPILLAACHGPASSSTPAVAAPVFTASPNLIVGRILAADAERGFAFVDVGHSAPAGALVEGAELVVRSLDLRETGRLRASRYVEGKTLGAKIVAGQPAPGDEVVWRAP